MMHLRLSWRWKIWVDPQLPESQQRWCLPAERRQDERYSPSPRHKGQPAHTKQSACFDAEYLSNKSCSDKGNNVSEWVFNLYTWIIFTLGSNLGGRPKWRIQLSLAPRSRITSACSRALHSRTGGRGHEPSKGNKRKHMFVLKMTMNYFFPNAVKWGGGNLERAAATQCGWSSGRTPFPMGVGRNGRPLVSTNSLRPVSARL